MGGTIGATVTTVIDTSGFDGTSTVQLVYQAERYGNFTYTFTGLISGANLQSAPAFRRNLLGPQWAKD